MRPLMDRYEGPWICGHCGRHWPCADLQRLCPPYLWPAGTTPRARIQLGGVRLA
jgi:hypothetical protein